MSDFDYFAYDKRKRRPAREASPAPRAPSLAEPVVRVATVLNAGLLAALVLAVLFGSLGETASAAGNELNLPAPMIWSWVFALPLSLGIALLVNRWSGWGWARNVNCTIGVVWAASIPFLWSTGAIALL